MSSLNQSDNCVRTRIRVSNCSYLYLCRHSPGASSAGITNRVDHVLDGGTPGSTAPCELTRDFHPVPFSLNVAEDWRSREGFQVFLECHGSRFQLASSPFSPRTRQFRQKGVPDQLTLRTSRNVAKHRSLWPNCAGMQVKQRRRCISAVGTQYLRLTCRMWWMLSLPKTSNILSTVTHTLHVSLAR